MAARRVLLAIVTVVVLAAVALFASIWRPAIAPINRPAASIFPPALIKKGAQLAAIGDCSVCHMAPDGEAFAGGAPIATPFGAIYATNITPDPDTGIGRWSEAAFRRALHDGVSRDGRYLYPAFPYDHFTTVTDEDVRAIYAFLMTRQPVKALAHKNDLAFPINIRLIMAGWNFLFLHHDDDKTDDAHDPQRRRGRYLAQGLGHCGACHTPRDVFGAEEANRAFAGGDVEGWLAPALNAASPDPAPWTADSLYTYLKTGFAAHHSFAAGPMGPVVLGVQQIADADIHAIAAYIASLQGPVSAQQKARGESAVALATKPGLGMIRQASSAGDSQSATIYASSCGWCHYTSDNNGDAFASRQKLGLGVGANAPVPSNLSHIILEGIPPVAGEVSPIMPGFAGSLTNAQVAALVTYIRTHFSDQPAWRNVAASVEAIRQKVSH